MQTTIATTAEFRGVGLHSGAASRVVLRPAEAGTGIRFRRTDLPGQPVIPATYDRVATDTRLCTLLRGDGASVATIEHLMAALAGMGVHNALVDVDGPEIPILDGSSAPFVAALRRVGLRRLAAPLRVLRVLREVEVRDGAASASLAPASGLLMDFAIDFPDAAIGRQSLSLDLAGDVFAGELSDSRTFCRRADITGMQSAGLAQGGTLFNAVVVDGDRVLTPGGLRHRNEAVRHKMLDALGDLALAGAPLVGHYRGNRAGHALTNRLLRTLFATPGAVALTLCPPTLLARLPGARVVGAEQLAEPAAAVL